MTNKAPIQSETFQPAAFLVNSLETKTVNIVSTAIDAGNTGKTYYLRKGLALGKVTASGKYAEYDNTKSDGREVCHYILMDDCDLKDGDPGASAADHYARVLVIGKVVAANCIGLDANGQADLAKAGTGEGVIVCV